MFARRLNLGLIVLLVLARPASGQDLSAHAGYFPLDELIPRDELTIEINLQGALLQMVANAVGYEDPEFSELVNKLEAIRVRVAETGSLDQEALRSRFENASRDLEADGWLVIVRVREYDEDIYIYSRERDGKIVGMTVFALESPGEAVVINIIGEIRPDQLMGLGATFDIPQLEDMPGSGDDDNEEQP